MRIQDHTDMFDDLITIFAYKNNGDISWTSQKDEKDILKILKNIVKNIEEHLKQGKTQSFFVKLCDGTEVKFKAKNMKEAKKQARQYETENNLKDEEE